MNQGLSKVEFQRDQDMQVQDKVKGQQNKNQMTDQLLVEMDDRSVVTHQKNSADIVYKRNT